MREADDMSHKAIWRGSDRNIPDLGISLIAAGDEFTIPTDTQLGGEGYAFDIIGGPDFDALQAEAKDLGIKGATKKTHLELVEAITLKVASPDEAITQGADA